MVNCNYVLNDNKTNIVRICNKFLDRSFGFIYTREVLNSEFIHFPDYLIKEAH